jgi:hypothetical protein
VAELILGADADSEQAVDRAHGPVLRPARDFADSRSIVASVTTKKAQSSTKHMTVFGLLAVTATLVFYVLEERSLWYILGFGGACALGSACR